MSRNIYIFNATEKSICGRLGFSSLNDYFQKIEVIRYGEAIRYRDLHGVEIKECTSTDLNFIKIIGKASNPLDEGSYCYLKGPPTIRDFVEKVTTTGFTCLGLNRDGFPTVVHRGYSHDMDSAHLWVEDHLPITLMRRIIFKDLVNRFHTELGNPEFTLEIDFTLIPEVRNCSYQQIPVELVRCSRDLDLRPLRDWFIYLGLILKSVRLLHINFLADEDRAHLTHTVKSLLPKLAYELTALDCKNPEAPFSNQRGLNLVLFCLEKLKSVKEI